jgi:alpha-glucosidase (family GH31 glycosyl hydrolase)
LIDATNPAARKWFWEKARDNVLSHGFDYPWLDETEPDLVPDGFFYSVGRVTATTTCSRWCTSKAWPTICAPGSRTSAC